jgi:pilin isopeptide linkage protein
MKLRHDRGQVHIVRRLAALLLEILAVFSLSATAFAMDAVEAELPVTVKGASCMVRLTPLDGAPTPETGEMELKGAGKFTLEFTEPGIYRYELAALPGQRQDVIYDTTVYQITVTVVTGEDGVLRTLISVSAGDEHKADEAVFENKLKPVNPDKPKTGDLSYPALWSAALLLSAAGLIAVLILLSRMTTAKSTKNL